jgi:hypothetical protein
MLSNEANVNEWVIGEANGMIDYRTQLKKLKWVSGKFEHRN